MKEAIRKRKRIYNPLCRMKSTFRSSTHDLFGLDSVENLHWGKLFIHLFGSLFSSYATRGRLDVDKMMEYLLQRYKVRPEHIIRIERAKRDNFSETDPLNTEILLILRPSFCISVSENGIYVLYGPSIAKEEVLELGAAVQSFKVEDVKNDSNFYMITSSVHRGLALSDFKVKYKTTDLALNYNDDFLPIHNTITAAFSQNRAGGLILLHGDYGCGKTYYIRHLIATQKKKFIYLPLHLVDHLSSPEFLPFITEHPDSILILEDCENYLTSRDEGNHHAAALSNLLNLGDGLLSDALAVNIICTFNTQLKKIDEALLRKGRLIARYEFKSLSVEKAQQLSDSLQKNITITQPMSLAGIYNIEQKDYEIKKARKIGFGVKEGVG